MTSKIIIQVFTHIQNLFIYLFIAKNYNSKQLSSLMYAFMSHFFFFGKESEKKNIFTSFTFLSFIFLTNVQAIHSLRGNEYHFDKIFRNFFFFMPSPSSIQYRTTLFSFTNPGFFFKKKEPGTQK